MKRTKARHMRRLVPGAKLRGGCTATWIKHAADGISGYLRHTTGMERPTTYELDWASDLFRVPVEDMTPETVQEKRHLFHKHYHPDRFAHLDNAELDKLLNEMYRDMLDRLQRVEEYLLRNSHDLHPEKARQVPLSAVDLEIQLITSDKELKYRLFGSMTRWLDRGERFRLPRTNATLTSSGRHVGNAIGFNETIPLYLTYGHGDPLDEIVIWLYTRIAGHVSALWVDGARVDVDPKAMFNAMARMKVLE